MSMFVRGFALRNGRYYVAAFPTIISQRESKDLFFLGSAAGSNEDAGEHQGTRDEK